MSDETWVVTLPKLGESVTEGVIGTVLQDTSATKSNSTTRCSKCRPTRSTRRSRARTTVWSLRSWRKRARPSRSALAIMKIGGKGTPVENRLPSAAHGVAAAGGRSLNDPVRAVGGRIGGPVNRGCPLLAVVRYR